MRQRRIWAWLLAIGVGLGMAGFAWADDDAPVKSGNWFTRLFRRQPAVNPKTDENAPRPSAEGAVASAARVRAQMELMRRQEVCDKLREIALVNSDDELRRKADQLDQRAWDAYLQKTSRLPGVRNALTPDEQTLERGLGAAQPATSNPTASRRATSGQASLKGNQQ